MRLLVHIYSSIFFFIYFWSCFVVSPWHSPSSRECIIYQLIQVNDITTAIIVISAFAVPNIIIDLFGHGEKGRNKVMHGLFWSPFICGAVGSIIAFLVKADYIATFKAYFIFALHHLALDSFTYQGVYLIRGWWLSFSDKPNDYPPYNALAALLNMAFIFIPMLLSMIIKDNPQIFVYTLVIVILLVAIIGLIKTIKS